jgi:predicted metal-dependent hydrolase
LEIKGKTASDRFDPFTDRLSRDIRNSLSEAFVKSLGLMDPVCYRKLSKEWLAKSGAPPYRDYIQDRLHRYESVLDQIRKKPHTDVLLQAIVLWNNELFFEVHDLLEGVWHKTSGDERQALKGLIKAAGVYIHMEYHRRQAAARLAAKSSDLIREYSRCLQFITNTDRLLDKLQNLDPVPPKLVTLDVSRGESQASTS